MRDHGPGHHEAMHSIAQQGSPWALLVGLVLLMALLAGAGRLAHRGLRERLRRPALVPAQAPTASEAELHLDMMLAWGEVDVAEHHERRLALRTFS